MGDNSGQYGNGTITAAWSNGTLTATGTTVTRGGSVGDSAGTFSDVYWDTTTTGIADDADNNAPEGKTTSELQTPTHLYQDGERRNRCPTTRRASTPTGTSPVLVQMRDGVAGNDNPWDFGHNNQYPVLHVRTLPYVLLQDVPTVTWAVANTTLCESSKGTNPSLV